MFAIGLRTAGLIAAMPLWPGAGRQSVTYAPSPSDLDARETPSDFPKPDVLHQLDALSATGMATAEAAAIQPDAEMPAAAEQELAKPNLGSTLRLRRQRLRTRERQVEKQPFR